MTPGAWVLVASVAFTVVLGLWRAATDGRFRGLHDVRGAKAAVVSETEESEGGRPVEAAPTASVVAGTAYATQLGERATLLQFSSAFCAPCRVTRRTLEEVAAVVPGVAHLEVDAESHLDLVRRLDVLRTPTTLVLDSAGREVARAAGAPSKQQVLTAVAQVM